MLKEQNILQGLADDSNLLEAVKVVFLKQFVDTTKLDLSDEQIGQITRARLTGIKAVEDACREIESHRSVPKETAKDNPAY